MTSIAIRSFILMVITFGCTWICRKRSAAVVHRIWALGFCGSLVIPFVLPLYPNWTLPVLPSPGPTVSAQATLTAGEATDGPIHRTGIRQLEMQRPAPAVQPAHQQQAAPQHPLQAVPSSENGRAKETWTLMAVAVLVWGIGAAIFLARLIHQQVVLRFTLRQCSILDCEPWNISRDAVARQLGVQANVPLKLHDNAASPMVAGVWRPIVILPGDAKMWSAERRELVLLHELAHVSRRDVLTQTVAEIACALYWFNPLAWWGAAQMRQLREIACDDSVVTHCETPCDYARTLLDVAKHYRNQKQMFVVPMVRNRSVESRIAAILDATRRRASLTTRSACGISVAALLVSLLVGALQLTSRADDPAKPQAKLDASDRELDDSRQMVIRVLDEKTRQPLTEANVLVSIWEVEQTGRFPTKTYQTDRQGAAEIMIPRRLGILRIWPSKSGYVPQFLNFARGSHEEGQLVPDEYEFQLQRGSRLSGIVVDTSGMPISNAKVQVRVEVEGDWGANPKPIISTWLANGSAAAVTNKEGCWHINNAPQLREGTDFQFQLRVTHPDFAGDTHWGELQGRQGITTQQLRAGTASLTLDPGIAIAGQISGPNGQPVTKGLVVWDDRPYWATGVNEAKIDANGRYQTLRLQPGEYPITILAPGFAPQQRIVQVSQSLQDVDFQLQPGNPIKIKILDQSGAAVPGAYVGIGEWRKTEAIYNEKHPNVLESGIPRRADKNGIYTWDWAPDDAVEYRISSRGYDVKEVSLVAKQAPHEIKLARPTTIFGSVVDAKSGKPIDKFVVLPVKAFRPDFYSTNFQADSIAQGSNGKYRIQINSHGQTGNRYRVRVEAEGYRTAFGKKSLAVGDPPVQEDFQLEPAPALMGTVVSASGKPVIDFKVAIGTATTSPHFTLDRLETHFGRAFQVQGSNEFQLPATFEPRRIRVFNESEFAEVLRAPDETIGVIKLQPWASVSGRLLQNGQPVSNEWIYFSPLVKRALTDARFQDSFSTKTDVNGNFSFDRLPPVSGTVKAHLGPWLDSVLSSSRSVPVTLAAGQREIVSLGGDGATITGRVVAIGRSNDGFSKNWSLNYLVSRNRGVRHPKADSWNFNPSGRVDPSWLGQPEFPDWLSARENHFVKLADDGRMRIHGVLPGSYDLVIQLYEQPSGCLIETIGEKVIPISITEPLAENGEVEIGDIQVQCRIGPRVGSDMRAFTFVDTNGRVRSVNDMSGRYVLFHVWASWCQPCLASMPDLKATIRQPADKPLTVVGLNLDQEDSLAKQLVQDGQWHWAQNYLGEESDMMRQLAVSSVPAYYLIGPDGKLVGSANEWTAIKSILVARFP